MLIYLSTGRHHNHGMTHACVVCCIGVAGSFSEGGQQFRPAKIQSFPANICFCQGGPSSLILFCRAKALFCQWVKMKEKLENTAETNQKWRKTDKNDGKPLKMWSFMNYLLPSSHFCSAELSFLFCQDPISVLLRSHFCPAELSFLFCQAPISVLPS